MSKSVKPLVSVIIPVYNVEKYLKQCVESVLAQTYTKIEIILVDDGSPDKSGDICDVFASTDSRVRVVHKTNEGLNFARKTGFENSTGEYILFVDSDDMLRSDAVEQMLNVAIKESLDLVIGGYVKFSTASLEQTVLGSDYSVEVLDKDSAIKGLLLGTDHKNVLMMTAWGKLYERGLIDTIDWSASNYRSNEDEFMALQYYSRARGRIAIIPEEFYFYRENPDSITRAEYKNSFEGVNLDRFDTIDRIYQEATQRLPKKYTQLVLAKFIYEFIIVTRKEVVNDASISKAITANVKYFQPKIKLFDKGVLIHIDPRTKAQYEGLVNEGIVGCLRANQEFVDRENEEALKYIHNLEASVTEKDKLIADKEAQIVLLSEEISTLTRPPKIIRWLTLFVRSLKHRFTK